jgi:hypothetical protein
MSLAWFRSFAFSKSHSPKQRRRRRSARSTTLGLSLERLEDRALLAVNATTWTAVGPAPINNGLVPGSGTVSGRITTIAADPTNANTIYVGGADGGVWKTTNGGTTWKPLTDNQAVLTMGSIAIAPSNHLVIYAGTGEPNNSLDSYYGDGILKSTNGGTSWTLVGKSTFSGLAIDKIVVDPGNANILYVADNGWYTNNGNYSSGNVGVWKSTDGGTTWTDTTAGSGGISGLDTNTGIVSDLVMDPSNSSTLYAAVGAYWGETANGIYKTIDGGNTWTATSAPSGTGVGRIKLGISAAASQTLYASYSNPTNSQLLELEKSTDGGSTWTKQTATPNYMGTNGFGQGWYDTSLAVDPSNADIIYAGGTYNGGGDGFVTSRDGGSTWTDIGTGANGNGIHTDDHALTFDKNGLLLDGNDGGIWRLANSTPGSIQWTDLNTNLQLTQFTGIALSPTSINTAYGGSQDNGSEKYTGSTKWTPLLGGDGGFVRVDFTHTSTVYHEYTGISLQRSDDGGKTWADKTSGIGNDPSNFYVPYVMDSSNSSRLVLGTDHVYETTNKGDSWTAIGTPNSGGFNSSDYNVDAFATRGSTTYASAGPHVFVTTNDGASWTKIDVTGYTSDSFSDIKIDPANTATAYIVRGHFTGSAAGHVFETTNSGTSWTDISGNLPDVPTNSIVLDSLTGILYVGTDAGVYASNNGGTSWSLLGTGLPNARVVDLEFSANLNLLAAGTHGRGMWEIDTVHFVVSSSSSSVAAGTPVTITVTAEDPFGNTINGFTGVVNFTSSDKLATLSLKSHTFVAADNGTFQFTVTFATAGNQTVTATGKTNATITGKAKVSVT